MKSKTEIQQIMKKREIIFILCVIAAACVSYIFTAENTAKDCDTVIVMQDGELYCTKPLGTDCTFTVGGTNTITVENGRVYMSDADCPDKLCIKQGKIFDSSKKIICLPNKIIVEVTKNSDMDTVVR